MSSAHLTLQLLVAGTVFWNLSDPLLILQLPSCSNSFSLDLSYRKTSDPALASTLAPFPTLDLCPVSDRAKKHTSSWQTKCSRLSQTKDLNFYAKFHWAFFVCFFLFVFVFVFCLLLLWLLLFLSLFGKLPASLGLPHLGWICSGSIVGGAGWRGNRGCL